MKALVYTASFGEYDNVHEPVEQSVDTDFIIFTERKVKDNSMWIDLVRLPDWNALNIKLDDYRLQAKLFKIVPFNYIPGYNNYDYTIWIDSSVQITGPDFVKSVIEYCNNGLMFLEHPYKRQSITAEYEACKRECPEKLLNSNIEEQINFYHDKMCLPQKHNVYACTMIARSNNHKIRKDVIKQIGNVWWSEIRKWSIRDQMSLPYVLYVLGISNLPWVKEYPQVEWQKRIKLHNHKR